MVPYGLFLPPLAQTSKLLMKSNYFCVCSAHLCKPIFALGFVGKFSLLSNPILTSFKKVPLPVPQVLKQVVNLSCNKWPNLDKFATICTFLFTCQLFEALSC